MSEKQKKSPPLLNPVLKFKKEPKPESITGGGKNIGSIKVERLDQQRKTLSSGFRELSRKANDVPEFGGKIVLYASMFSDSQASSYTPTDLFNLDSGAQLIAPFKEGYLVELEKSSLTRFVQRIANTDVVKELVDISRIQSVRFHNEEDVLGGNTARELWKQAPNIGDGRVFIVWFMPFQDRNAVESLLQNVLSLRQNFMKPIAIKLGYGEETAKIKVRDSAHQLTTRSDEDSISIAMRNYRRTQRAYATVVVPTPAALGRLLVSGSIYRMEPVKPITSTSPGEGREPRRPLPENLAGMPIVGIVDGGLTASSYKVAEAWRAPNLIPESFADTVHGNRITSIVVQGHDWNNNLALSQLYCRVGVVQAVSKTGGGGPIVSPQQLIMHLDKAMSDHPDTKVWNFSLNETDSCNPDMVSLLGHAIAELSRKHNILPVISIGNASGKPLSPPADCEAALTIGGRLPTKDGKPGDICPISSIGPGPSSMLKPELSHFSQARVIGGDVVRGSSFSTAFISSVAAHTMQNLRDATPDQVKALLIHQSDLDEFHPSLGFGTPETLFEPWVCRPGFVTLNWRAPLRQGMAYYWELPIPRALKKKKHIKGFGKLTAVLNPHPLVRDFAGPNYFSARINTALQYPKNINSYVNLLGSMETDKVKEQDARDKMHKWSPVRHHTKEFGKRGDGLQCDGDNFRIFARVYTRDLYMYEYHNRNELPALDVVFVLTLGTGNEDDDVYNDMRNQLGPFVESSVIETDIDIEN